MHLKSPKINRNMSSTGRILLVCLLSRYLIVNGQSEVSPDDEDFSDVYDAFVSSLETRTGLSSLQPSYIIVGITSCDGTTLIDCTVNPNGSVIWEARLQLYEHFMKAGADNPSIESLGACQLDYATSDTYNECMKEVRSNMNTYLIDEFDKSFATIMNKNCSLIQDNCV